MDRFVSTVARLFEQRFGVQLVIQEKSKENQKKQPLFSSYWSSHFVYSRTHRQVSFPIFNSKKELQALAIVHPVENKDAIAFEEMSQFLQLTIAEHVELTQANEFSEQKEIAIQFAHRDTSKIINLKTKKATDPILEFKRRQPARPADTHPLWLKQCSSQFAAQIAFSAHDWVHNWAFMNAKEIPDLIWSDDTGWESLDQVTLFIPDIETLTEQQWQILKKNYEIMMKRPPEQRPFLILASQDEPADENHLLLSQMRHYIVKGHIAPRIQAHFILFCHEETKKGSDYVLTQESGVFYLPFSRAPENLH